MAQLDVSIWNLSAPVVAAGLLAACGPNVPLGGETEGQTESTRTSGPATSIDPATSPTRPVGPTTDPTGDECRYDADCPGYYYYCENGVCVAGCLDCCYPECGWYYECYSHNECAEAQYCRYQYCYEAQYIEQCDAFDPTLIPIPTDGEDVYGLAYSAGFTPSLGIARADGLSVWVGGAATPPVAYPNGGTPLELAAGDLVEGPQEDFVVSLNSDQDNILLGEYDGVSAISWYALLTDSSPFSSPVVGDFNGDGLGDIAGYVFEGIHIFTQGFGFDLWPVPLAGAPVVAGDLNGDMIDDIVSTDGTLPFVWYGNAGGGSAIEYLPEPSGASGRRLATADFNGDSQPDVVAISGSANGSLIAQFTADGGGGFIISTYLFASVPATSVTAGDLNGDGRAELLIGHLGGVMVFRGGSDGESLFECQTNIAVPHASHYIAHGSADPLGSREIAVSSGLETTILRFE